MIRFGFIGTGWRTRFYLRVARARPDLFEVVGMVSRNPDQPSDHVKEFAVKLFGSIEELLDAAHPLFIVTSVPWSVNPATVRRLAELEVPVLSETPPATTVEEMVELYRLAEAGAKIQVAEQYWAQPHHAARLAFARSGKIGDVTQAQVSAAHGYHGISLIRRFLGVGFENAKVTAQAFTSPIVKSPDRRGLPTDEAIVESSQLIAQFDFGDRLGVFDFTNDQYYSYVRGQRLLVRGERGEIINQTASYLQDVVTPIHVTFARHVAGLHGNLEGHYLKGIQAGEEWVYKNPLAPGRMSDDEIAIGICLLRMAEYIEGGQPFYSLAEACQDRYLDIVMHEAAEKGETIIARTQPWAG